MPLQRSPWQFDSGSLVGLLIGFVLLRSAFLLTLENPEPRYTLECYPVVIICAAACLAKINRAAVENSNRNSFDPNCCSDIQNP